MTGTTIDLIEFQKAFERFQELTIAKSGHQFETFHDGLAAEESYKPRLRDLAISLLCTEEWADGDIGTGKILNRTINAIEIQENRGDRTNNLVLWQNRYGHANRDHRLFLDAVSNPNLCREIESLLYGLYRTDADEGALFDQLSELTGGKYPLLAYLYFLKDMDRFMPIQPTGFDQAFHALGIDFSTKQQCNWVNYNTYNETLDGLRKFIAASAAVENVRLIDAHSFCWIFWTLVKQEAEGELTTVQDGKDEGRVLSGRESSIIEMRQSTENTVRNANGQIVERSVKNKELRMTSAELEELIASLLDMQDNCCALTGIPLHFVGPDANKNLQASLDRIDSDKHYERGNLQVVCRFINFWKSDSDNEEFKRLLMLVRGEAPSD